MLSKSNMNFFIIDDPVIINPCVVLKNSLYKKNLILYNIDVINLD